MSWTKQQIIEHSLAQLALAGYEFDITPDELQSHLRTLDMMMALWNQKNIRLGYPIESWDGCSNLDDDSCLPLYAIEPVYSSLSARICAGYGKAVPQRVAQMAKEGYELLCVRAAMPPSVPYLYSMPAGAGNKTWTAFYDPFLRNKSQGITSGQDGEIKVSDATNL